MDWAQALLTLASTNCPRWRSCRWSGRWFGLVGRRKCSFRIGRPLGRLCNRKVSGLCLRDGGISGVLLFGQLHNKLGLLLLHLLCLCLCLSHHLLGRLWDRPKVVVVGVDHFHDRFAAQCADRHEIHAAWHGLVVSTVSLVAMVVARVVRNLWLPDYFECLLNGSCQSLLLYVIVGWVYD